MRHDGPWLHKSLEPGTTINQIQNLRDPLGRIIEHSRVRYSCDEFPPATWVEGGNGFGVPGNSENGGPSYTRCAAIQCARGDNGVKVKAEQNWQALSHQLLRIKLIRLVKRRKENYGQFQHFDEKDSIVFFRLRTVNQANGIAARVYHYSDPALSQLDEPPKDVTQAKRSDIDHEFLNWANTVSIDELVASGKNGSMDLVLADDTSNDMSYEGTYPSTMGMNMGENVTLPEETDEWEHPATEHQSYAKREVHLHPMNSTSSKPLLRSGESLELARAREIVEAAILKSSELNKARYERPMGRKYKLAYRNRPDLDNEGNKVPPLLEITKEIAAAAALVSNANARMEALRQANFTKRSAATYWMQHIERKGTVPWGDDPNYKVRESLSCITYSIRIHRDLLQIFRNVRDFGATGDGTTDDTDAINRAVHEPRRCGERCNGSTTKNAIVYFPPGTYRVSTSIQLPFGTQVIGDANNWPTILASSDFIGVGVLSTDEYTGGGVGIDGRDQQWFVNTANFYRQIRNLRIDITATRSAQRVAAIHYQVAQATSIQNVEIIAARGSGQRGIFAENGSGGVISDITFRGGRFGIYGGNQQFTAQRLTFDGCTTAVRIIWDWGWVWKSITIKNARVGFRLLPERPKIGQPGDGPGNIGSAAFIDSSFHNVETAVLMAPPNSDPGSGSTGIVVENVEFRGVGKAVADTSGAVLLGPADKVDHWALGPVYSTGGSREFSRGRKVQGFRRQQGLLDSNGGYFERPKPQYEDRPVSDFVHVKDFGARGDGSTDDTAAFQEALRASRGRILFVDAGSYILTGTVTVPSGSKIVGEAWSQLVASDPKPMIKVGNAGEVGDVEMQDLLFTSRGPTAGLVSVEWNIMARSPGSAALWDCHVRVGGATGTDLTPRECPPITNGVNSGCHAGSLMMHITPSASGYFENMWLWVADHMIEYEQTSIYVARGLLVESQSPVWLYGTSSEHAVYYQYNFHNALNVFAGMIQTESPYYQPNPRPPAPFESAVGVFSGDPEYNCAGDDEFSGCDSSWGLIISRSSGIYIAGAGIYSWFSTYGQDCSELRNSPWHRSDLPCGTWRARTDNRAVDGQTCQKALVLLQENYANVRIHHLITIGAKYMIVRDGVGIPALDNLNVKAHPRWSQISVLDVGGGDPGHQNIIWIDPIIWDMEKPSFTCAPPCTVKLPPWTRATSVVDYPRITVSDGTWTSTITKAPLTISKWVFEVATLKVGGNGRVHARQDFEEFWPKPASTSSWPAVRYIGPNGRETTTAPSVAFPTPPPSIGPGAPPPPSGHWPRNAVRPEVGAMEKPLVDRCSFYDPSCYNSPLLYKPAEDPLPMDDGNAENWIICPEDPETSSTTTTPEAPRRTDPPPPPRGGAPKPNNEPVLAVAIPGRNYRECYDGGRKSNHDRLDNSIKSFCNSLGKPGDVLKGKHEKERKYEFPYSVGSLAMEIVVSLTMFDGCQWTWNFDECSRYLHVPVDSCNCEGVNGKQGGTVANNCLKWRIDPNTKH
ncbi:hypothetical protein CP533_4653 [Ophiocordyceps camponoti-saundersi (nom. inval.)]|nr:hypothetical protein CP533_4653 [Ophiocordyceps camponoti-saundersi (nom. inval.)]